MTGLEALRRNPGVIGELIAPHPPGALRSRPFAGKWTPNEILGHLVDHEIVTMCRIRTMRMNPAPWLESYDQERWVEVQRHNERDGAALLERLRFLRALNLEQYESLSEDERTAPHRLAFSTSITLADLIDRHAAHDAHHIEQLRRYLAAARDETAE